MAIDGKKQFLSLQSSGERFGLNERLGGLSYHLQGKKKKKSLSQRVIIGKKKN